MSGGVVSRANRDLITRFYVELNRAYSPFLTNGYFKNERRVIRYVCAAMGGFMCL